MKREVSLRDFDVAPEYFTSQMEIEKSILLVIKRRLHCKRRSPTYPVIQARDITTMIKGAENLKLRERSWRPFNDPEGGF